MMMMNDECMIMDKKHELFCNFQVIVKSEGISDFIRRLDFHLHFHLMHGASKIIVKISESMDQRF